VGLLWDSKYKTPSNINLEEASFDSDSIMTLSSDKSLPLTNNQLINHKDNITIRWSKVGVLITMYRLLE